MKLPNLAACWTMIKSMGMYPSERKYAEECGRRSRLSDDEFWATYYSSSSVRRDIPLRIRKVLAEQLGFDRIVPSDSPSDILCDIDLQVILDEIADEFGVPLSVDDLPNRDGSFDSIVRLVNSKFV